MITRGTNVKSEKWYKNFVSVETRSYGPKT